LNFRRQAHESPTLIGKGLFVTTPKSGKVLLGMTLNLFRPEVKLAIALVLGLSFLNGGSIQRAATVSPWTIADLVALLSN
jgi:hypothetical protein